MRELSNEPNHGSVIKDCHDAVDAIDQDYFRRLGIEPFEFDDKLPKSGKLRGRIERVVAFLALIAFWWFVISQGTKLWKP
jgi:hypothetical protein